MGFLTPFVTQVTTRLVDPAIAPALSRAIVDAGFKLMSLEVSPQDEARAAASAVAATVEETVRRVSALPDYVLDNQELLEGFALEAFEQAAAANLPPVLSEAVYRDRPDLLESSGIKTCWVMLPLRRRKRYKKCARVFKVRITPHMADEIESFSAARGLPAGPVRCRGGAEVEAEVHLFETLPGTTLPDIAREESQTPGVPRIEAQVASQLQLHPLTRRAAGLACSARRAWGAISPCGRIAGISGSASVCIGYRFPKTLAAHGSWQIWASLPAAAWRFASTSMRRRTRSASVSS